jgi:uncharacterized protein (UPF0335 family)
MTGSKEELLQYIDRIEKIMEDVKNLNADLKEIYSEAKSSGFDVKALKQIIKIRQLDPERAAMDEEILQSYKDLLGM